MAGRGAATASKTAQRADATAPHQEAHAVTSSGPDLTQTPVTSLKGVGAKGAETLERLGITTVADLLAHYPHRYEDRSHFIPIADLRDGETATIIGKVTAVENRPTKTRLVLTRVTLDDG